jgi:hypothetical protein
MFEGEDGSLSKKGKPGSCFIWVGSGLTYKHQTRLKRPARNKHSSLLGTLTYGRKEFFNIDLRDNVIKLFTDVSIAFSK